MFQNRLLEADKKNTILYSVSLIILGILGTFFALYNHFFIDFFECIGILIVGIFGLLAGLTETRCMVMTEIVGISIVCCLTCLDIGYSLIVIFILFAFEDYRDRYLYQQFISLWIHTGLVLFMIFAGISSYKMRESLNARENTKLLSNRQVII